MTYQRPAGFAARLHTLAGRLIELKDRVREAVAVEVGRIVGEAVRELTTAVLRGHLPNPATAPHPRPEHAHTGRWNDDPDDWDRVEEPDPYEPKPEPPTRQSVVEVGPRAGWVAALTGGVEVARYWAGRTGRWWVGAAVGLLAAAASVFNNPSVGAIMSVVTTFAELVSGVPPVPS